MQHIEIEVVECSNSCLDSDCTDLSGVCRFFSTELEVDDKWPANFLHCQSPTRVQNPLYCTSVIVLLAVLVHLSIAYQSIDGYTSWHKWGIPENPDIFLNRLHWIAKRPHYCVEGLLANELRNDCASHSRKNVLQNRQNAATTARYNARSW